VEEAATTTSMATNMDLPAVEDSVRSLANSLAEATTTTSNILAATTMDRREVLVDLQAWPARSWEAAALPTTTNLADSTDRTRTTATVEAVVRTAATTSNNMDQAKATAVAVAEASSAASWVVTSPTVALAATAIPQAEAPAVPTLALRHPAPTSPRDSRTTANLVKVTALTVALRHQTHTSLRAKETTASLVKDTAPTVVQHLKALHRSLALTTHLETNHMDNNPTVDHHNKVDIQDTNSPAPTADHLNSTVATTKAVTALEVTISSNREAMANPKADTVATRLLLVVTEVADTSNSMATAVTEDDFERAVILDIET
jgi:hypothetical protein